MARHLFIAFSNPTIGKEKEFNEWQSAVHIPDGLGIPGFIAATFYRLATTQILPGFPDGAGKYVTLWEVETDDLQATKLVVERALPGFTWSDAIDDGLTRTATYTAVLPRRPSSASSS